MRKSLVVIGLLLLVTFYVFSSGLFSNGQLAGESKEAAEDFTLTALSGAEVNLNRKLDSAPVLLVFLSTWCEICKRELPVLKKFYRRNKDQVELLAVFSGESERTVAGLQKEFDLNFPLLPDPRGKLGSSYPVSGVPTHFAISRRGKIQTHRVGLVNLAQLRRMVETVK